METYTFKMKKVFIIIAPRHPTVTLKKTFQRRSFGTSYLQKSAKYENEKKYVKNIIQLTEAQLTEKEIKAVEIRVSKWTPTPRTVAQEIYGKKNLTNRPTRPLLYTVSLRYTLCKWSV
ncbi:hypothetical protein BSPWISOXPB_1586 [uncultured Gammaproteobacteria bacterium]|nr:hypothetical protein BSPWISOXPB_1586 [uncultured Gammaproteobacteria bacterium]